MVATAATFIPMSYNVLASFNLSQLTSLIVDPLLTPKICVCTAPLTPVVHRSALPPLIIVGAMAVGGGCMTRCVISDELILRLVMSPVCTF